MGNLQVPKMLKFIKQNAALTISRGITTGYLSFPENGLQTIKFCPEKART